MSERDEQRGLYEWTTRLGEVLELRIGPPPPSADGPHFLQVADAWPEKLTSQDLDETQPYLSQTQRSVSADPVVDRTLCVLEAGARILEDPTLLLAEGTSHPNPQVAWTAQRLLDYPPNLPGLEHEPGQPLDQQARGRDPRRRPAQRDGRRKNTPR